MPPLNPNHLSPTGQRVYSHVTVSFPAAVPGTEPPAALLEFAGRCVDRAQRHQTSDRMAARMERFAADVAAARAASMQASVPAAVSVGREAKGTA